MSKSQIFLFVCLAFLGGIFLSSFIKISPLLLLGFLALGLLFISIFWRYKKLAVVGFCILFLVLGIWRHQFAETKILKSELQTYNDKEEIVTLIGVVSAEPDVREKNLKLTVKLPGIEGKVLVTAGKYLEYKYGDKLKIKGFLKTPQEFEDFNYKDYLAKDGIYSVMYYPEIELIERSQGNFLYAQILSFKDKLREVVYQNLSPPQSSIIAAIILGDKRQISQEWKDKLNYAGLRHLTAISGMHVAVFTVILMSFLIGLGLWRKDAFFLSMVLVSIFIVMTGLQPSAIRAGIMGGLFLFAQYLGRMNESSRVVVLAAALMLAHNPLLLKLDVGFQLSFLAMLGIIYLLPVFQNWLRKVPDLFQLKNILAMTLSAQAFTLPVLIYNFGYFSLVSPFTSILIVPLLPLIMGLGFIFALSGTVWGFLGWFFSLPVWLLLTYLVKITEWFSDFSFSVYVIEVSWAWLAVFYSILGFLTWYLNEKQKLKFLQY